MSKSNPNVQQLQTYLKAKRPFGIGYALPADGVMTPQFESVLRYLQSVLVTEGHKVSLLNGSSVNPNAVAQLQSIFETKPAPTEQDKKPTEEKAPETDSDVDLPEVKPMGLDNKNAVWEGFLNQNLPVVGKVYDGDLEKAAKNLEAAIGKEIGKSMAGIIWNDKEKSFNTTPDDIQSALEKIKSHKEKDSKTAQFTQDQRVIKFAELLQKWSEEKK